MYRLVCRKKVVFVFRLSCILCIFLFVGSLSGQELSSFRRVKLAKDAGVWADSLLVDAMSIELLGLPNGERLDFERRGDSIIWEIPKGLAFDSILLKYRVLNLPSLEKHSSFDTSQVRLVVNRAYIGMAGSGAEGDGFGLSEGLDYDGSFLRGLSFGNNQSLFLDSRFNLQISGDLGGGTYLKAALTDENLPLEADGSTQQLREFDRMYIEITNRDKTLVVGDIVSEGDSGHFLKFYKKLRGGSLRYVGQTGDVRYESFVSGGVSRGKFNRLELVTEEGNQGPYRLIGVDGEQFIIILSGSERVYYDGRLLVRGEQGDYTMDYNRALIAFSPNCLITKDSRIVVEYEYRFDIYARGFVHAGAKLGFERSSFGVQYYSEADGVNPLEQYQLTDEQLDVLRQSGDRGELARASSIRELGPLELYGRTAGVSYEIRDSMGYRILVASTDRSRRLYRARFSELGPGKGDYIEGDPSVNGRVYVWVAPNPDGSKNGRFDPVVRLSAPQSKRVMVLNGAIDLGKNTSIVAEGSMSNNDYNKLSLLDDRDNVGGAFFVELAHKVKLGSSDQWSSSILANMEYTGSSYDPVKVFREQEFSRYWNSAGVDSVSANDRLGSVRIDLKNRRNNGLELGMRYYGKGDYEGFRPEMRFVTNNRFFNLDARLDILSSNSSINETTFVKPKLLFSKPFGERGRHKIESLTEIERNQIRDKFMGSVSGFSFLQQRTTYRYDRDGDMTWQVTHVYREDGLPLEGSLVNATTANEFKVVGRVRKAHQSIDCSIHYRKLEVSPLFRDRQQAQDSYLGRVKHRLVLWGKALVLSNIYEIGSGQQERMEVVFVETPQMGQGQYIHRELTGDSIKQNFEFFVAPYSDLGNYVRVQLGTTEFFRTKDVGVNQNLRFDIRRLFLDKEAPVWARFLIHSSLISGYKNESLGNGALVWNPYRANFRDGRMLNANRRWKTDVYFNRSHPVYQINYAYILREGKDLLTTGLLTQKQNSHTIKLRYNMTRGLTGRIETRWINRATDYELFDNRDSDVFIKEIDGGLSWLLDLNSRLSGNIIMRDQWSSLGGEGAKQLEVKTVFQTGRGNKSSMRFELSYIGVRALGRLDPLLQFEFLNGLSVGANWQWTSRMDLNLGKYLRLNVMYSGRKLGSGRVIHTGNIRMGATF